MSVGPVLVVGFGPFLDVVDNPAARLARAVDGWRGPDGLVVVGAEMPVSFRGGPAFALALADEVGAAAIVGIGVAVRRSEVAVERWGTRALRGDHPDNDGVVLTEIPGDGPERVEATGPVARVAAAIGAVVSEDAGGYVCNAWLYQVTRACDDRRPVLFLHVPAEGMAVERLRSAIVALWSSHLSVT